MRNGLTGAVLCLAGLAVAAEVPWPKSLDLAAADARELETGVSELSRRIETLRRNSAAADALPDVEIFLKALAWPLRYGEFFETADMDTARWALREGLQRAESLARGETPWRNRTGPVMLAYRSRIDDSLQPYVVDVPAEPSGNGRAFVYCQPRSDTPTELRFLEQMRRPGPFHPRGTFVVYPYGRYRNSHKFAGETDMTEALADAARRFPIDMQRVVLTGFSMGGGSVWHLAGHHAWQWAAASPGSGFAETADHVELAAKSPYPVPWWERWLHRYYDITEVPGNLTGLPLIGYYGDRERNRMTYELMSQAMASEGLLLEHLQGPNTAHAYEPGTLRKLTERLIALADRPRPRPARVRLSTWSLRFNRMHWVEIDEMTDTMRRADMSVEESADSILVGAGNVNAFTLDLTSPKPVIINGGDRIVAAAGRVHFRRTVVTGGKFPWKWESSTSRSADPVKRHGLSGPIDDAFLDRFVFVLPSGRSQHPSVDGWVKAESERAIRWWRSYWRGEAIVVRDTEVTAKMVAEAHLVLWGDPASNALLRKVLPSLPVQWNTERIQVGSSTAPASDAVLALIYPNPLNPERYVVLNSGSTSDARHLWNTGNVTPKLPDWAILGTEQAAGSATAREAGFFDVHWQPLLPSPESLDRRATAAGTARTSGGN